MQQHKPAHDGWWCAAAGYFDAPCAYLSPLSYECLIPLPPVTLVFCCIQDYDAMKVSPALPPGSQLLLLSHLPASMPCSPSMPCLGSALMHRALSRRPLQPADFMLCAAAVGQCACSTACLVCICACSHLASPLTARYVVRQLADAPAAQSALSSYRDCVRRCIVQAQGYECQESGVLACCACPAQLAARA